MNTLKRFRWGAGKVGLFAILVGIAAFALARDHRPAGASHTEIFPSTSSTSATYSPSVILVKGGQENAIPCDPDVHDPTAVCLHVWAKNVDNTSGASAFQVRAAFNSNGILVNQITPQTAWIGSTQRSVFCGAPVIDSSSALASCNTLLAPPPYGPNCPTYCTGRLAVISVVSQSAPGTYTLDFSQGTYLVDTPGDPDLVAAIPALVRSTNIVVAPCADFNADGTIRVGDILYVVGKYHTDDVPADLNVSGSVRVDDILIAVGEYHIDCTA